MVKVRFGLALGMNIAEIATIGLLLILIGIQIIIARVNARITREGVVFLDQNLAAALETLVESLPEALEEKLGGAIEPINPIQAVFANILQDKLSTPITAQVITKDAEGKFSSEDTSLITE